MFEDRLAQFARERLGGRNVPEDLRILLIAQWEGREDVSALGLDGFLEPGQPDPLRDHSYLSESKRRDPEMQALMAASDRMSEYVKLVAEGGKGWIGYWVHPDQPADEPAPIIVYDTEASFWGMDGENFAEACIADAARYSEDPSTRYTELADRLIALGVPISSRVLDEVDGPRFVLDPDELSDELADEERAKRGLLEPR